jgi:hypothetical protein
MRSAPLVDIGLTSTTEELMAMAVITPRGRASGPLRWGGDNRADHAEGAGSGSEGGDDRHHVAGDQGGKGTVPQARDTCRDASGRRQLRS